MSSVFVRCTLLAIALVGATMAEMPKFFGADPEGMHVREVMNTCDLYANDNDLALINANNAISQACNSLTGKSPDRITVNENDGEPYKACLMPGSYTAQLPFIRTDSYVVSSETITNPTDDNITRITSQSGDFVSSLNWTTLGASGISLPVPYSVKVPVGPSAMFPNPVNFYSNGSATVLETQSKSLGYSWNVTVPAHCQTVANITAKATTYIANGAQQVCMDGYIKCSYNERVNGHYWWYIWFSSFASAEQRCVLQKSTLSSTYFVSASTSSNIMC